MLFADDAKLYSTINDEQDCLNVQADLDSLVNWSKDWLINFNKKKCVVLRLKRSIDFDYYIEDHKLLEVTEQADLGIIISNDLKPSKHIAKVASKGHSMSNHPMVETVPPQILMKIYTFGLYGQKRRFAK